MLSLFRIAYPVYSSTTSVDHKERVDLRRTPTHGKYFPGTINSYVYVLDILSRILSRYILRGIRLPVSYHTYM